MEGLPRASHSGDRRAVNREGREPAYRQEEAQAPVEYAPRPARSNPVSGYSKNNGSSKKGIIWTIAIAAFVVILGAIAWFVFSGAKSQPTGIDNGRFQAVFLANGQIYFGKLQSFSDSTFKMTTIYYPQTTSEDSDTAANAQSQNSNIKLIRLGDEVHGPGNEMYITKDQILYYENLKADSRVSKLIDENEKK